MGKEGRKKGRKEGSKKKEKIRKENSGDGNRNEYTKNLGKYGT